MTNGKLNHRYDFLLLFDVEDGNPNGDPDFDNQPRFDPETFQGLVSDVSLKRKVRDYVYALKSSNGSIETGYDIYVLQGSSLESRQKLAFDHLGYQETDADRDSVSQARQWMCGNFFDVRAFGAVMSTKKFNCGQVRGPVQLTFARSFDRVLSSDHGITRVAYTTEEKTAASKGTTEMGSKHTVAYGLYRCHGFVNPHLASQTGFSQGDLAVLWKALVNLFELDRSAARGLMAVRHLFVFKHASALGEAPAHRLFELVQASKREVDGKPIESPRSFSDYRVTPLEEIRSRLPEGVTVEDLAAS